MDVEKDYHTVVNNGTVVKKTNKHSVENLRSYNNCDCSSSDSLGEYRDIVVNYEGYDYYIFHSTPIVITGSSNKYMLSHGGWKTKSTKRKINKYTPSNIDVYQEDGDWYVEVDGETRPFKNWMIV